MPGFQHDAAEAQAAAGYHLYEATVIEVVTELKSLVAGARLARESL